MIPSDVLARVRDQLVETTAGFWTDAEIYRYMTDAEREINDMVECFQRVTATTSVTAQSGYTLPTDCVNVMRVTYDGVPLKQIDMRQRDALDMPGYGGTLQSGDPTHWYRFANDMMYLWKTPGRAATVQVFLLAEPPAITTASSGFSIPIQYHTALQDYVLYRSFTKDQDQGKAEWHKREFLEQMMDANRKEHRRRWAGGFQVVKNEDQAYSSINGMV